MVTRRDRAPTANSNKASSDEWPFNVVNARRAFNDCYQVIGSDLSAAREEGGETDPMTAEDLFWCVLDNEGMHFHPPQDFKTWLDATHNTDELVAVVPVVLPHKFYE